MSRRNALFKQVAAAYSVDENTKSVDFSKLLAIGNGEKVTTPIAAVTNGQTEETTTPTFEMLNVPNDASGNMIIVFFDTDNNRISIFNVGARIDDTMSYQELLEEANITGNGYFYATCALDGQYVANRGFGSFIIKTRAEK